MPARWCGRVRPNRWPRCCGCAATPARTSRCRAAGHRWWRGPFPSTTTCCCPPKGSAAIGDVDLVERRIQVGSGATLAAVQHAAVAAGLVFGVDLAARDTATVGGMASTNAGGLRTVRYGNMGEQVLGLEVALPDGSLLHRDSRVRSDNTGYDLPSLFVGAEGTLGRDHRAGSSFAPDAVASGDGGVRVRVAGGACRGRPGVSRRGRDRGAGADRRAGGRTDPRASRRGRRPSTAIGCCWWSWPPTTIRPTGSPSCSTASRCAASPRWVWMSLRSNGCGVSARVWRRCSACTGRR